MIRAGVVGATGYAGAELVRLLSGHPGVELAALGSVSFSGRPVSEVYPSYLQCCDLVCEGADGVIEKSDVVFAALPGGLSQDLAAKCLERGRAFIDLGGDFRLRDEADYTKFYGGRFTHPELHRKAVYGLTELNRGKIAGARLVSNPGCYATAVSLALIPALKSGLAEPEGLIADCKSGVTGSGRGLTQNTHYPELNGNVTAYKIGCHRHRPEIEQTLRDACGVSPALTFVPHLLPVNRGILATCYARLKPGATERKIREAYEAACGGEFFLRLLPAGDVAQIKCVRLSNYCDISLNFDGHTGMLVVVAALDNMVKGAAGQAVQNMNVMFGLRETMGLTAVPPAF